MDTLLVIISNKLTFQEEDRLVRVLRDKKKAIGWTIADIKSLSPSICIHKILLDDDCKPCGQPPVEVVKKEILRLFNAGVIYAISDSKWVSPTRVVPKKTGITVITNDQGKLVPTRIPNGWHVCIDY